MAKMFKLLFLFSFVSTMQFLIAQENKNVSVAVYYETLCPDSKAFIARQLYPTYLEMGSTFSLHLIPYGKASKTKVDDGSWSFQCQHGQAECDGNKRHACVLKNDTISEENKMQYIDCVMRRSYLYPGQEEKCATTANISWSDVIDCSALEQGANYLAGFGDETDKLVKSLPGWYFVPTIVFNNEFKQEDQDNALRNFKSVLCSYLDPNTKGC